MRILTGHEERKALDYIGRAKEMALRSTCQRDHCGSVIVQNDIVIGYGFNSPPGNKEGQRRCSFSKDSYHKKVTDKTCCVHAEQRAIADALRTNPSELIGSRLYFIRLDKNDSPTRAGNPYCTICSKTALDEGLAEFVLWREEGVCVYDTDEYNLLSFQFSG